MTEGDRGLTPHGSWPLRDQGVGEAAEQIGLGTSCREGETNAAGRLGDTGGDFEKPEPDRCELGRGQITRLRDGVAHSEDEPIGGGVENEADLVGERRAAAGAVGGELGLVQFDQVLGLSAGAIETVVNPLGRADAQAGDDVTDVEPLFGRLDAGDDAALAMPGPGGMAGLGIAAHHGLVVDRAFGSNRVGGLVDLSGERLGAGQAEDIVDAVRRDTARLTADAVSPSASDARTIVPASMTAARTVTPDSNRPS